MQLQTLTSLVRTKHLLPAKAHVRAEDRNGTDVEEHPSKRLEDIKLKLVDVANVHEAILAVLVTHPEEVEMEQTFRKVSSHVCKTA